MPSPFRVLHPGLLAMGLLAAAPLAAQVQAQDPVILSFAVTGDCRIDPNYPRKLPASPLPKSILEEFHKTGDHYPFYFNVVQVRQTLRDLADLKNPEPRYLFITGDLVHGFARDGGVTLRNELKDFTQALSHRPSSLTLVPLPGNHETTFKEFKDKKVITGADDADSEVWSEWIHDNHYDALGGDGPGRDALDQMPGNAGRKLKGDQSHVSYSFDDHGVHFVVLNTDTCTDIMTDEGLETEGLLPLKWVKEDLDKAQANDQVKQIFVVGHKPVHPPADFEDAGEYDALHAAVAEPFRKLLVGHSKVVAYLCSHAHLWHVDSLADKAAPNDVTSRPLQMVGGNGGVIFEKFWHPERESGSSWLPGETKGPYFGFTLIKVHASGKVTYNSWQREPPDPYYGGYKDAALAKARPRAEDTSIR